MQRWLLAMAAISDRLCRAAGQSSERFYAAFDQVGYPHDPKPNFAIDVVLFREKDSLKELGHDEDGVRSPGVGSE